jgi:mono/diheme cytochrome c family protein
VIRRSLFFLGVVGSFLFVFLSFSARAQQSNSTPSLTDTQKEGRRIFQQRCAVCHTPPTVVSKLYGPALYREIVEDNDDNIREVILEGRADLMPGFKYGLKRAEIDSIIEYLKTVRRPSARPAGKGNTSMGDPEG